MYGNKGLLLLGNSNPSTTLNPPDNAPAVLPLSSSQSTTVIDGETVEHRTLKTTTLPLVTASRVEDTKTANLLLADIPVVKDTDGSVLLQISAPLGVGFSAEQLIADPLHPLSLAQTLTAAIEHRVATTAIQSEWQQAIDAFTAPIKDSSPVTFRSVTFEQDATATTGRPVILTGATGSGEGDTQHANRQEAVLVDAHKLTPNTEVQLPNLEFALVMGKVNITGGAGTNTIVTDGQSALIASGAGDDRINPGVGTHTIDGGAGKDTLVYNQAGPLKVYLTQNTNDTLHPFDTVLVNSLNADHNVLRSIEIGELQGQQSDMSNLQLPGAQLQNMALISQLLFAHAPGLETINKLAGSNDAQALINAYLTSAESTTITSMSNHDFASSVVTNALGNNPEATVFVENYLQDHSRGELLLLGIQNEAVLKHAYGVDGLQLI